MGVLAQSIATLSRTSRTPRCWRRWRTTSSSSFPTFLASCLPSLWMMARASGCQPPKVSTAMGRKVMPSPAHLSSYFLSFRLWACSTAELPSSEADSLLFFLHPFKKNTSACINPIGCGGLETLSGAGGGGKRPHYRSKHLWYFLTEKWFPTSYLAETKMFQQKNNPKVVCNMYN